MKGFHALLIVLSILLCFVACSSNPTISTDPSSQATQPLTTTGNTSIPTTGTTASTTVAPTQTTTAAATTAPTQTTAHTETTAPTQTTAPTETTAPTQTTAPTVTTAPTQTTVPTVTTAPTQTTVPTQTTAPTHVHNYSDATCTEPATVPNSPTTTPSQPANGTTTPTTPIVYPTGPNGETMLPEYQLIYEMNTDMVGWITIPDTKINYPVMQTPDNKDYYLNRNFNKLWSDWGSIYALEACDINSPSDNVTLYGHHMKDGSMFAELDKFKQEYFWKTHQTFTFDTLYEHHTYQIWAVFKTSADLDEGFAYHQFTNADSEEEFDQYVATIKSMQFYETGITPQYGDKLLCLSTCEYTLNDGRFVVMAMRIS